MILIQENNPSTKVFIFLFITFSVFFFLFYPANAQQASQELHNLFDEAWEYQMEKNPIGASIIGNNKYDDQLPDFTIKAKQQQLQQQQAFLERLHSINRSSLSDEDKLNYDMFEVSHRRMNSEIKHKSYLIPINSFLGFHIYFAQLPDFLTLDSVKNYRDFISRLQSFKRYTQQHIDVMKKGQERGYLLPKVVAKNIPSMLKPLVLDTPATHLLYKPFKNMPRHIKEEERKRLQKIALAAIDTSVVAGYQAFYTFLKESYIPNARETIAATALPNGEAYYQHKIQYHTTLDRTAKEIHETGKQEVRRIREQMMEIVRQEGYEDFNAFVEFLRTDEQFYADSEQELLKEYAYVLKQLDGMLPKYFKKLPRTPYGIKKVPEFQAPNSAVAYYMSPPGDGSRAGIFFINTYDLSSRPLYEIESLAAHEAVPGHHLESALTVEQDDIPNFRRHYNLYAYSEGWGLYAEWLGKEMGIYNDTYSDFGRLSNEIFRAMRLVVDTGIHALGWSRQQAIDYMLENSAMTETNVKAEVNRYISMPGQALSYKMGEIKIKALRREAEKELGDDFDIREFHHVILKNGAVPLEILETETQEYIQSEKL